MDYFQLSSGLWKRKPKPEDEPQPVRCWYMLENHTFCPLPLDVDEAIQVMREERDAGNTYGMLCGTPDGVVHPPVTAGRANEWEAFEAQARPWLESAVAASKPPANDAQTPGDKL